MTGVTRPSVRLVLDIAIWRHGWGPVLGVAMVLAAAAFWATQVRPLLALAQQADRSTAASTAELLVPAMDDAASGQDRSRLLRQQLQAIMPPKSDAHRTVAAMVGQAQKHAVRIESIDVQFRDDPQSGWSQASYSVPLEGSYPAIRQMIEALLREHAHLALDQISFRRDSAAAKQLEVQVRLTGWYVTGPGPAIAARSQIADRRGP